MSNWHLLLVAFLFGSLKQSTVYNINIANTSKRRRYGTIAILPSNEATLETIILSVLNRHHLEMWVVYIARTVLILKSTVQHFR